MQSGSDKELKLNSRRLSHFNKEQAEMKIELIEAGYSDYLLNTVAAKKLFKDNKTYIQGGLAGKFPARQEVPAGFITEDKYDKLLNMNYDFNVVSPPLSGAPWTPQQNMMFNLEMASHMSFVMDNWDKGTKGKLRTTLQDRFRNSYAEILKIHGNM